MGQGCSIKSFASAGPQASAKNANEIKVVMSALPRGTGNAGACPAGNS
jgi:hypothetical protein